MTLARELADTAGRPQVDKNLLINGGMNVWQRSTSESVSTDGYSTVDRWRTTVSGLGVFTVSRSTDVPSGQGFSYSTKWDCTTADASPAATDILKFEQRIEGQNLQHLLYGNSGAKKLIASFWVKSNKTGVYTCGLYSADNSGRHIESSFTISSASTWEKKEVVFDGDTASALDNDNAESLRFWIWLGAGSNFSSGTHATSWAAYAEADVLANSQVNLADSTSNELYITGCQLEIGESATDFQFESYGVTWNKCLRYFDNRTNLQEGAKNYTEGWMVFPVYGNWRATPTVTYYDNTGGGTWNAFNITETGFLAASNGIAGKTTKIKIDAEL